jgi:CelD/BcsL family acetyltransferase involved in cellulose biosynthesis
MSQLAVAPAIDERVSTQLRVQVVSTYQEFLGLEPVWDRLVLAGGQQNPFQEFGWARAWWDAFGDGSQLNVLVVWANDEAVAIAPLVLTRLRLMAVPVRRLGFFYNAHVPRADFIVGANATLARRAIWQHLATCGNWDLLQLCQIPAESETMRELPELADLGGHRSGVWSSSEAPYIPLAGTWQEYLAGLASKHRANLRNRFKRLSNAGAMNAESIASPEELDGALADGIRLEAAAWKGDEGTAIASSAECCRFYSEFARYAARRGWLRINFLRAGDRRIAFQYALDYQNQVFLLKEGYDPAYSAYSPSSLLLAMQLESLFGRKNARFDLLGDFVEWKRSWARQATAHCWLYVYSRTSKGRWLHFAKFRLTPLIKRMLRKS